MIVIPMPWSEAPRTGRVQGVYGVMLHDNTVIGNYQRKKLEPFICQFTPFGVEISFFRRYCSKGVRDFGADMKDAEKLEWFTVSGEDLVCLQNDLTTSMGICFYKTL